MFDLSPAHAMPRTAANDPQNAPLALPQSAEFARALRAVGQSPLVLDRMQDMVVLRRKWFARLPIAMINRADLKKPARLLEILQEEGLRRTPVVLSPERPTPDLGRLGALPLMTPASIARLDLSGTSQDRRARLRQKWRNRLNAAEAAPLRVTRQNMPIENDHWLLRADTAQQKQRLYSSWPHSLTLAYAQENPGAAKLFQAFEGRDVVAAILVLTHGDSATYHISHSFVRGRQLGAHNLLMWSSMEWLAAKGISSFDLGVVNTEDASGLARFKLGTGANVQRLGGTWVFWPPFGRRIAPLARLDLARMGG